MVRGSHNQRRLSHFIETSSRDKLLCYRYHEQQAVFRIHRIGCWVAQWWHHACRVFWPSCHVFQAPRNVFLITWYHQGYVHGNVGLLMAVACPSLSSFILSGIILMPLGPPSAGSIRRNLTYTYVALCTLIEPFNIQSISELVSSSFLLSALLRIYINTVMLNCASPSSN